MFNLPNNRSFIIQSITSRDIDHMSEIVKPWNFFARKLDKGDNFFGKIDIITSRDFFLLKTDYSNVLDQAGAPPGGMRTFYIPVDDSQHSYLRKCTITGDKFGLFPLGAELEATSRPGFRVYVISFPEQLLCKQAAMLRLDWTIVNNSGFKENFRIPAERTQIIRNLINQLFTLKKSSLEQKELNYSFEHLKKDLIDYLILTTIQNQNLIRPDLSNRVRIFKSFRDYIYTNINNPYSSSELCEFTAASERTLQYVVKDYTGIAPAQFFKGLKLSLVREELSKRDPVYTKISQVANEFGFWHTAQFATDYRNQFGELPSETLKK